MKYILTLIAVLALTFTADAGCGKKKTTTGTLSAYDTKSKKITVMVDKKKVKLQVTSSTKGDPVKLKGKNVVVISEHGKIDSIKLVKKS